MRVTWEEIPLSITVMTGRWLRAFTFAMADLSSDFGLFSRLFLLFCIFLSDVGLWFFILDQSVVLLGKFKRLERFVGLSQQSAVLWFVFRQIQPAALALFARSRCSIFSLWDLNSSTNRPITSLHEYLSSENVLISAVTCCICTTSIDSTSIPITRVKGCCRVWYQWRKVAQPMLPSYRCAWKYPTGGFCSKATQAQTSLMFLTRFISNYHTSRCVFPSFPCAYR